MLTKEKKMAAIANKKMNNDHKFPLRDSGWITQLGDKKFYFSTYTNKVRFEENIGYEIAAFNERLNRMYKFAYDIDLEDLAVVRYYMKIEKRGFYLKINEVEIECLNDLTFEAEVKPIK